MATNPIPAGRMTGDILWKIVLDAHVPDAEMVTLGEDVGHKKPASEPTQKALLKIAAHAAQLNGSKILFSPSMLFAALQGNLPKMLERRPLLEGVAYGYKRKIAYPQLPPGIQGYLNATAMDLPTLPIMPAAPPPPTPTGRQATSATSMGAHDMSDIFQKQPASTGGQPGGQAPKSLTVAEWSKLQATVKKLATTPAAVDSHELATARNFAARGGLDSTKGALDWEISMRGDGAQDPDRNPGAAPGAAPSSKDKPKFPLWPVILGPAGLLAFLSFFSHRGHREMSARIAREHASHEATT
jgi:hypothetical protein